MGLVGARRARQGLGPFAAAFLQEAGAVVPGFLATRPETLVEASRVLAERGVRARGHLALETLLAEGRLDALAILSPSETHAAILRRALDARLHVLCEKPLVWGGPDPAVRARALVDAFAQAGLLLRENCQWPRTLPAFAALHPGVLEAPIRSFAMHLEPISQGAAMLPDALPHPLSLLQELAPGPARLEDLRFDTRQAPGALGLRFLYVTAAARVEVAVDLVHAERTPRAAAYAVNGHRAQRRVRASDYGLSFSDGSRSVPVPDPLRELLRGFVAELEVVLTDGPKPAKDHRIADRMDLLAHVVDALAPEGGP